MFDEVNVDEPTLRGELLVCNVTMGTRTLEVCGALDVGLRGRRIDAYPL